MNEYRLGKLAGLEMTARPSALFGFVVMWAALAAVADVFLHLSLVTAIAGALMAAVLHWTSEVVHQLGHASAARRAGHPMAGIRFWGVLSSSVYPADEPRLGPAVHIQRALGGPGASLMLTVIGAAVTIALRPLGGVSWLLAVFLYLDNLLVFSLGSMLPLGFTDGSTLLYWFRRR